MDSGGSLVIAQPPVVHTALNDDARRVLVSLDGAETVTEYLVTATSASFAPNVTGTSIFQLYPQHNLIMERKVLLRAQVVLTQTANGANAAELDLGGPVPTSYPLNSAIESISVTLNGRIFTSRPKNFKHIWERLYSPKQHQDHNAFTPTMRDNDYPLANMIDITNDGVPGNADGSYTQTRNGPFGFGPDGDAFLDSRKMFRRDVVVNAGPITVYTFTFTEPLLIDLFEMFDESGITNINQLEIKINWAADGFSRMFSNVSVANVITCTLSAAGAGGPSAYNCNFAPANQQIIARYVTPSQNLSPKNSLTLPYQTVQRFAQQLGGVGGPALNAGLSTSITFNSMILNVIPRYIILSARMDPDLPDAYTALAGAGGNVNYFCNILSVSITIDNTPSILVNATHQQLYQMAVRNGFSGSYMEWGWRGQGFFIAEIGKDIGGYIPGSRANITIQPTITFQNMNSAAFNNGRQNRNLTNVVGECFFITDGFVVVTPETAYEQLGFGLNDVNEALAEDPVSVDLTQSSPERQGKGFGSVFRTVRNVFGSIAKPMSGVLGMFPHPGAQVASQVLSGADRALNGGKLHHHGHHGHREHEHEKHHHRRHKSGAGKLMA